MTTPNDAAGHYDAGYGTLLDTTVRIATWNVWGRYGPWAERLPAIVETLRSADADIVCLQECWEHPGEGRSQAGEIAAALGYELPIYAHNLEWPDGTRSGNAVLARWPRARDGVLVLPRDAGAAGRDEEGEERLCVFAEIDGPRGAIQVYCAHLSWRGDHGAIRQLQVAAIANWVRDQRPRTFPAVLCGDLNALPDSDEIRMLTAKAAVPVPGVWFRDAWEEHGAGSGHTWSNTNPFAAASLDRDARIDYLLTGAPKARGCGHVRRIELIGDEPIDGMFGSDHFGLVADLRY